MPIFSTIEATLDPLTVTADDLVVGNDLEIDGYPFFEIPELMCGNGYFGPIFVCPQGSFISRGRLRDPHPIYAPPSNEFTGKKTSPSTIWERACEILSKHHVPEPRWHDKGHWPRLRPAMAAGQVPEVWLEPCGWAKRMFLVGWALQNPHDNNRRWFYRNPDLACLRIHNWVPEKVPLP